MNEKDWAVEEMRADDLTGPEKLCKVCCSSISSCVSLSFLRLRLRLLFLVLEGRYDSREWTVNSGP